MTPIQVPIRLKWEHLIRTEYSAERCAICRASFLYLPGLEDAVCEHLQLKKLRAEAIQLGLIRE